MEWFIAAMKSVHSYTVKNCWIACKILTLPQIQELETWERHNNKTSTTVAGAVAGVSHQEIEELSVMLSNLGKCLSQRNNHAISMIEAVDLIDMELEREVFDPPTTEMDTSEQDQENDDDDVHMYGSS